MSPRCPSHGEPSLIIWPPAVTCGAIIQIKWFTRNAKDYSGRYGPVLDPHVLAGVSAHKCILDGEVRVRERQKNELISGSGFGKGN